MASVLRYQQAISAKIERYTDIPALRNLLSEKVNRIAVERFRQIESEADSGEVEADFNQAVRELKAVEQHVFNIKAPPSLVPQALYGAALPLSLNQSILQHSVRTSSELLLIAKVFNVKDSIRGIIPLTTERRVMQNLVRRFV